MHIGSTEKFHPVFQIVVFVLFVLAFLFRIFHFSTNIQFDSDFGRDSLFAMRILKGHPTLLGPQASVGGFYLAPLYFYGVAAVYGVFGYKPEILSFVFILMGMLALWIGYVLQKRYVSRTAAVLFLFFSVAHPWLVTASRNATNQPMMPLATMICITTLLLAIQKKRWFWYLLFGASLGLFFHVHLSALVLFPSLGLLALWFAPGGWRGKTLRMIALGIGFFVMLSPLLLFDIRHGGITSKAFFAYLQSSAKGESITANLPHWTVAQKFQHMSSFISQHAWLVVIVMVFVLLGIHVLKKKWVHLTQKTQRYLFIVCSVALSSCVLLVFYKGYLFEYYLLTPFTVALLAISSILSYMKPRMIVLVLAMTIFVNHIMKLQYPEHFRTVEHLLPILHGIERQIETTKPKSFAVFKDSADGMTGLAYEYRFLLERDGYVPVSEYTYEQADVLYVIGENGMKDPTMLPNWEVSQFGPRRFELVDTFPYRGNPTYLFRLTKE